MEMFTRLFHPSTFDLDEIETINSAFIKYCYVGEDKYEMVESTQNTINPKQPISFFRNGKSISESLFLEKTNQRFCVEKNRSVFVHDYHVCFFDIYIKPNYQILPIIIVDFANEEEKYNFTPLEWFGEEVNERFYNEKTLWITFQSIPK